MAHLYGMDLTRDHILQRVGDISQVAGVTRYVETEGKAAGVEVVQVRTGTGFSFSVLAGRGLDIGNAEYCGKALAWRSQTGNGHSAYFEPEGLGWLRDFHGGLLTSCGLTYAGAPCEDDDETLGLHGRMSYLPAQNLYADSEWQGDDYVMWVQGKIRESAVFGPDLVLTRKIMARLGESRFFLRDRVENCGWKTQPHMLLYHINGGWPVVDEGSELLAPSDNWVPRDKDAEVGKEEAKRFQKPTPGFAERVYFHDLKTDAQGYTQTALVNRACDGGIGFYVRYQKTQLPQFTEWKMNDAGTYVVGMEPGNCLPLGRNVEREAGRLQFLEPGEVREYDLEIGVLDGEEAIAEFEAEIAAMT